MSNVDFENGLVLGMALAGKNGLIGVQLPGQSGFFTSTYEQSFGPNLVAGSDVGLSSEPSTIAIF